MNTTLYVIKESMMWHQRDPKFNLYYMGISETNMEEHCYFNTEKKGISLFSIFNQKTLDDSQ